MYKASVHPHLGYIPPPPPPPSVHHPILGISLNNLMEKVERIQYQTELAFTGAWQGSSCVKLYEELGWDSIYPRLDISNASLPA